MKKLVFEGTVEEKLEQFIEFVKTYKKGSFVTAGYCSIVKTKAAFKDKVVVKMTEGVYRMGIEYANTAAFKDLGRDLNSLPASQKRLDGYGEFLMYTVGNEDGADVYKVKLFTAVGAKSTSTYTIDGQPTTYEELVEMGAISPKKASTNPLIMFTVYLNNLLWVGC